MMPRADGSPTEKELERACVEYVKLVGGEVDEFSQRRRGRCRRCGLPVYAGTQQTKGIPDLRLVFTRRAMSVWCEVKVGKRKLTPEQRSWMYRELALGQPAIVVYSVPDLVWALHALGATRAALNEPHEPHPETAKFVMLAIEASSPDSPAAARR